MALLQINNTQTTHRKVGVVGPDTLVKVYTGETGVAPWDLAFDFISNSNCHLYVYVYTYMFFT